MSNDFESEVQELWQGQPRKEPSMTVEEIRAKAQRFERKVRRGSALAGAIFVFAFIADGVHAWRTDNAFVRAAELLTMAALAYVAYYYRDYGRVSRMPASLGRTSCAEFYRAQLVRQRELSGSAWPYLLPFVPGLALIAVGRITQHRPTSQIVVLVIVGVGTFVGCLWVNARSVRKLNEEIAAWDEEGRQ